jgi:2-polyprenyl-6-methoxyphenol hydroxylase-like FAD-dependent oxidoreductase
VIDVVIAGPGPNGLMLACELGSAGIRPEVLDPMPGPNPQPWVNRIVGQATRILDHRDLYSALTGADEPPAPAPCSVFVGFLLNLTSDPGTQLFTVPIQLRGFNEVLADRAGEYGADTRWGHALTGFDQHDDGVVGADGGTSMTRHLAGIDFPGMSSYDLVMRMAFNVVPPDEWMAPVSGALDKPGYQAGRGPLPPLRFHRTDRGVFSCGAMESRVVSMTYELDSTAREQLNPNANLLMSQPISGSAMRNPLLKLAIRHPV